MEQSSEDNPSLFEDLRNPDLPSFEVPLFLKGDEGSGFRTENDPADPYQRANWVERHGAIDIRCSCLDIVHGTMSDGSGNDKAHATLIVLQFRFDPRERARRLKRVNISLEFKSAKSNVKDPEVHAIAPDGSFQLVPLTQHEEAKRSAGIQAGVTDPTGIANATGSMNWERTVSRDTTSHTKVIGSIDLRGRNYGAPNFASWTLLENETFKTGVPSFMKTGIILKRKSQDPFECLIEIDADADFKSQLISLLGGKGKDPRDDPVLFDPTLPSSNFLQNYESQNLGTFNLECVSDITLGTIMADSVKQKGQKPQVQKHDPHSK